MAAAFSIPLLLATALLLLVQKRLLGRRGYAAVGGKGGAAPGDPARAVALPRARARCLAVLAAAVFLPYGILLKAAFSRAWAQPLTAENFTLENWSFTFLYSTTQSAIVNTHRAGRAHRLRRAPRSRPCSPTSPTGGSSRATRCSPSSRWRPVVIPGVVLAVALFVAYTRPPFLLYGTLWILFLAYLTKEMPVGYSQSDATLRGIHPELEEAGRILGAGRFRVLARDHRAARPQRDHRHVVLRLHRGDPRAVGLDHPLHARTPR